MEREGFSRAPRTIVVADYDPRWPEIFERLRSEIWPAVGDVASAIEHVGSTSVPGLPAKPIIDVTVILPSAADVPLAIQRLATLGYEHQGDLGISGREAFKSPERLPRHHLYLCPLDSTALANHLAVRDYLRAHPDTARDYGALKKRLAREFPHDIGRYIDGKTDLLLEILRACGLSTAQLEAVARVNRKPDE